MDAAFQEIITHLVTDYGIAVFDEARYKALLSDYANETTSNPLTPVPPLPASPKPPPLVSVPDDFVRIPDGTFMMGTPALKEGKYDSKGPQHQVTVSSFYMGKYEVTQKEYAALMRTNPSYFRGDSLPVENVSWFEAVEYCNTRSQKEGFTPAYTVSGTDVTWNRNTNGYRLPTEAEWEYACRAGTTTPFSTDNNITTDQTNYDGNNPYHGNTKEIFREKTIQARSFSANKRGLYDLHGNVYEWCWDWYGGYSSDAQTDPLGASSGTKRVARDGNRFSDGRYRRSAFRFAFTPSTRGISIGFRLVRPSL